MKQTKRKREVAKVTATMSALATETEAVASLPAVPINSAASDFETSPVQRSAIQRSATQSPAIQGATMKIPAIEITGQAPTYSLGENCTVRDSLTIKSELLDLIMDMRPVTIDVSTVKRIDTAVLQVLCAFVGDRNAAGGQVRWLGSSESFCEAVCLLGLKDALGVSAELLAAGMA